MATLFRNIDSLVTVNNEGKPFKVGVSMGDVGEIRDGAMVFDEKIRWVGKTEDCERVINASDWEINSIIFGRGKTVMPGFVDSHMHIVFAGNRANEFGRRLRGATYKEIAQEGGGILHTMAATRNANVQQLAENGLKLAGNAMRHGTTSIESKSGYGLSLEAELNQLKANKIIAKELGISVTSTFMGAHDFPPEYADRREEYLDIIINEMLPRVAEEKLAEFCDAFVDEGYYTPAQGERLFDAARKLGFKIKCHCDELANVEAAEMAARAGATSADHLLFVSQRGMDAMRASGTCATLLPGTAYFIRMPYAPAKELIQNNNIVALATDCNPGSCFTENMQTILSLAVINMRMTAEEAINAATINGAYALGKSNEFGSLEPGKRANFIVANMPHYTEFFYHFGINNVAETWINGNKY
ncbi:MAG: imidazolonepropionase [Chloroflexota bacterium]